tara:strand:- start:257 stop:574 length:318 start_codon:yes stop_codon:yes gene_type:complete
VLALHDRQIIVIVEDLEVQILHLTELHLQVVEVAVVIVPIPLKVLVALVEEEKNLMVLLDQEHLDKDILAVVDLKLVTWQEAEVVLENLVTLTEQDTVVMVYLHL